MFVVQVLVTVNVLIKEAELGMLVDMLASLEALEVDAIIVQVHPPHRGDTTDWRAEVGDGLVYTNDLPIDDVWVCLGFPITSG